MKKSPISIHFNYIIYRKKYIHRHLTNAFFYIKKLILILIEDKNLYHFYAQIRGEHRTGQCGSPGVLSCRSIGRGQSERQDRTGQDETARPVFFHNFFNIYLYKFFSYYLHNIYRNRLVSRCILLIYKYKYNSRHHFYLKSVRIIYFILCSIQNLSLVCSNRIEYLKVIVLKLFQYTFCKYFKIYTVRLINRVSQFSGILFNSLKFNYLTISEKMISSTLYFY